MARRHRVEGNRLSRAVWFFLGVLPLAVIVTASRLVPSPLGHGTHTQLGLPPCGFLLFTGYPCPGCGLTTAFAHMTRGEIFGAAHANAFGIPLFLVSLGFIPLALTAFVRRWGVVDMLDRLHVEKAALLMATCSLTVWIVRVVALYTAR